MASLREMYEAGYREPTLVEALSSAGFEQDRIKFIAETCFDAVSRTREINAAPPAMVDDEAAMLSLYSFDFGEKNWHLNPFSGMNSSLRNNDVTVMHQLRDLIYLTIASLRKLPRTPCPTLYRGLCVAVDRAMYYDGAIVKFDAFSSTSTSMDVAQKFVTNNAIQGEGTTIFIITNAWGYKVKDFSFFQGEDEVLLEPGLCFRVQSVICNDENDMIVNLELADDTQLLLTDIIPYVPPPSTWQPKRDRSQREGPQHDESCHLMGAEFDQTLPTPNISFKKTSITPTTFQMSCMLNMNAIPFNQRGTRELQLQSKPDCIETFTTRTYFSAEEFVVTDLEPGTKFQFRCRVLVANPNKYGPWCPPLVIKTADLDSTLPVPTIDAADFTKKGDVTTAVWKCAGAGPFSGIKFVLQMKESGTDIYQFRTIFSGGKKKFKFKGVELKAGTTYDFRVRCAKGAACGAFSQPCSYTM